MPQQVPGKSLPERPTRQQEDELAVQKLLYQHSPSYSERYEKWGEAHRVLQTGLEAGADYALGALGPKALKRLPGAFKAAGDIWEAVNQAGVSDWATGGRQIKDPRLRVELQVKGKYEGKPANVVLVGYDTKTERPVTSWNLDLNHHDKQVYISYAMTPDKGEYGTGQYKHILREVAEKFPEMETVRFFRISGAGPKNKGYEEEVTAPLDLFRSRDKRTGGGGKIVRRRMGGEDPDAFLSEGRVAEPAPTPEEWDAVMYDDTDVEARNLDDEGLLSYYMPDDMYDEARATFGDSRAYDLERAKRESQVQQRVMDLRREGVSNLSEAEPILNSMEYQERANNLRARVNAERDRAREPAARVEPSRTAGERPFWQMSQQEIDEQAGRVVSPGMRISRENMTDWDRFVSRSRTLATSDAEDRKIYGIADDLEVNEDQALQIFMKGGGREGPVRESIDEVGRAGRAPGRP